MNAIIKSKNDLCTGCNRCVRECPMETANITYQDESGKIKVKVDDAKCISCGLCISACKHNARDFVDDTGQFFADLANGIPISLMSAPAIRTNIPEYKRLFTWLKRLGVNKIYDVSLGADICIWGHVKYVEKGLPLPIITQPCPAVVTYLESYQQDLLPRLSPVHGPVGCASVYMKQYQGITDRIALLSPCIAKKTELEDTGLGEYNISFGRLAEYLKMNDITLPHEETGFDHEECGLGSLFPMPGGLKENIEYFTGKKLHITKAEGYGVYEKLNEYAKTPVEFLPDVYDVLNCAEGCNIGPAALHQRNVFEIDKMMDARRRKAVEERKREYYVSVYKKYDDAFDFSSFLREYRPDTTVFPQITDESVNNAFGLLGKNDFDMQHVDCGACGSDTCYGMARKIALGVNIPVNCIVKSKEDAKTEHEENIRAHAQLVEMERRQDTDALMRVMIDRAPFGTHIWDKNLKIIDCNQAAVTLFKLNNKAEYLEHFNDFSPEYQPDGSLSKDAVVEYIRKAFETGYLQVEWTHKALDGELIPSEMVLVRIDYKDGYYVVSYIQDIREQKKMIQEIETARATTAAMFESNPQFNVLFDSSFKVVDCNPAGIEFMGFNTKDELIDGFVERISKSIPAFQSNGQPSVPLAERLMTAVKEGRVSFETEVFMGGVKLNLNVEFKRVPYESSFAVVGYIYDITETKNLIQEIERQNSLMHAINNAAVLLLESDMEDYSGAMQQGMEFIGRCLEVDRVTAWQSDLMDDGKLHLRQVCKWSGDNSPDIGLLEFSQDDMPGWIMSVSQGEIINGPVSNQHEEKQKQSAIAESESILIIPISLNEKFWGMVSFDVCNGQRVFPKEIVQLLHSWGLLAVASIQRSSIAKEMIGTLNKLDNETAMLKTIFDSIPDLVFCKDLDSNYTRCNKQLEAFYKVSEADLAGKNDVDGLGFSGEVMRQLVEDDQKVIVTGQLTVSESSALNDDGSELIFETIKAPIYNNGVMEGILGISRDITERKNIEEALKLRESMTNTLNEMSIVFLSQDNKSFEEKMTAGVKLIADMMDMDVVSVWRNFTMPDGLFTSQIYRWDGKESGTVPPRPELQNVPYAKLTPDWEKILRGEKAINGPVRLMDNPPAALVHFNVVSAFLTPLSFNNEHWGFVLFEDLHNERYFDDVEFMRSAAFLYANTVIRYEMEEMLKVALDNATSASRAKSDFLANMSHEIRTPMNAIIGMTNIGKSAPDMERMTYSFEKIEDASKHLLGIINDILDMSKIEAGKLELVPVDFDFEKMLQRVINVVSHRVDEKELKLTVHVDKAIPKFMIGDDQRLAQVITNLLGNAVKFTPEKGAINLDTLYLGEENGICTVKIAVTDTGIGITPEQQANLFQSFQQAESSTSRKFGGSGLGLVISKGIVEMMGGEIGVVSEIEKGSTFSFTIQVKRGETDLKQPEEADADIDGIFEGRHILLAEDVEINREIVLALLEPTLLNIDCAENGIEAVRLFTNAPDRYDMILMDLQMPEMDGYQATRAIRALDAPEAKAVPIVAMTANVFREDIEKCLEVGMNGHIGKPLNFDEVLSQLRSYL